MVLNKRQRKKMFRLWKSGMNAMDNYMGDNLCPGNVMNNLSRKEAATQILEERACKAN